MLLAMGIGLGEFHEFVDEGVGAGVFLGEFEEEFARACEGGGGVLERILVRGEGFLAEGIGHDHVGERGCESAGGAGDGAASGRGSLGGDLREEVAEAE
jgi:hypothetical protein